MAEGPIALPPVAGAWAWGPRASSEEAETQETSAAGG